MKNDPTNQGKGMRRGLVAVLLAFVVAALLIWRFGFHDSAAERREAVPRPKAQEQVKANPGAAVIPEAPVKSEREPPSEVRTTDPTAKPLSGAVAIGGSGRITTAAMEQLELSEEQATQLGTALRTTLDDLQKDFAARTKVVETREEKAGTYMKYYVEPRADRGQGVLDALEQRFAAVAGAAKAQRLMESLGEFDFSGGLGQDAWEFEFIPREKAEMAVESRKLNAAGQAVWSMRSGLDSFEEKFGEMFEVPAQRR